MQQHNAKSVFVVWLALIMTMGMVANVARAQTSAACDTNVVTFERGFYGRYFNMSADDPGMQRTVAKSIAEGPNNYWYSEDYFAFSRVDESINFGENWLPVDTGKRGDPFHFATHWRGVLVIRTATDVTFRMKANNDAWLYLNGELMLNIGNKARGGSGTTTESLGPGVYQVDIYFSERSSPYSIFEFSTTPSAEFRPLPPGCNVGDVDAGLTDGTGGNDGTGTPPGRVLGTSTLEYTSPIALWKTPASPDVYAIYANGFRHYITSPTAFERYGYDYRDIVTVTPATLNRYPDVRLVRSPEDATIYFIYTRPDRQWLKIAIPSPTAFISYTNNHWGNMVVVDALDIAAYPEATLVKTANAPGVYLIENGEKHLFLSADVFEALDYSWAEVVTISPEHLNTYRTGDSIG